MNLRSVSSCLVVVAAFALAACGGGGHSGPAVVPTTGPAPGPSPTTYPLGFASAGGGHGGGQCPAGSPAWGCPSVYALSSDPSGVQVKRVDPSGQMPSLDATLTTPANDPLPDSSTNLQYQFASTSAAGSFNVAVQQIHDGPHQVYFNRNEDSTGTVDATQLQAIVRKPQSTRASSATAARVGNEVRRLPFKAAAAANASDRIYVRFSAASLQSQGRSVADAVRALGTTGTELPTSNSDPLTVVAVPAGRTAQAYAQQLQSQASVAAVFPVRKRYALSKPETLPSDPSFNIPDQWYFYTDGFPYAWSYTQGTKATIAVIDTGVDLTNGDFQQNVVFSEQVLNGTRSSTELDHDGHGTNVAGIADAAVGNTFPTGSMNFAGGGYNAKLIAIRIFSDPNSVGGEGAFGSDEALAIGDAVTHGADVINLSLGGEESFNDNGSATSWNGGYDEGEYEAVEAAIQAGTVVVAAAGNNRDGGDSGGDGYQHDNLDYPAAYAGVISVGATQLNDNNSGNYTTATESVTPYSQSGVGLSLVAPGGNALSDPTGSNAPIYYLHWIWNYYSTAASPSTGGQPCTYAHGTLPSYPENCTAFFNGTSQATPQVSAAAALLIAAAGGHHAISPAQVAQILEDTADNINDPNQGHGRLNVYRALAALTGDTGAIATGPQPTAHAATQAIAFAYNNSGSNRPVILDYDYPIGVPIANVGSFRIADVRPADASSYKVGVWYDANGNGIIDTGDYFGASSATCTATAACAIGTIRLQPVSVGFTLP